MLKSLFKRPAVTIRVTRSKTINPRYTLQIIDIDDNAVALVSGSWASRPEAIDAAHTIGQSVVANCSPKVRLEIAEPARPATNSKKPPPKPIA